MSDSLLRKDGVEALLDLPQAGYAPHPVHCADGFFNQRGHREDAMAKLTKGAEQRRIAELAADQRLDIFAAKPLVQRPSQRAARRREYKR